MPVEKWTTSYSEKVYSQKKIYLWDNGVKTLLTGNGDEEAGRKTQFSWNCKEIAFPAAITRKAKERSILSSVQWLIPCLSRSNT